MPAETLSPLLRGASAARHRREVLRLFAAIYLPAAAALVGILYAVVASDSAARMTNLRARESIAVDFSARLLTEEVAAVAGDLMVLSRAPAVKDFSTDGSAEGRRRVAELFAAFSREKRIYDQVRYLDADGMEVVRVNFVDGRAAVVPDADLQPKGGRYFFRDSIALADGEAFVSPLDLNIEHDRIEMPLKPMLRFGAPVFDRLGRKKGVVILNFLGQRLLDDFTGAMGDARHAQLLNRDGYWLKSPDPSEEWGFMLGRDTTWATRHADEWQRLLAEKRGSFAGDGGLLTFATVHPLKPGQRSSTGTPLPVGDSRTALTSADYFWVVVSRVPAAELPGVRFDEYPIAFAAGMLGLGLLAILVGVLSATLVSRRLLRQAVFESERQLREIAETLGIGVLVVDAAGRVTYSNPEAGRLLGWPLAEMVGREIDGLVHDHARDDDVVSGGGCPLLDIIATGDSYRSDDETFRCRDGTRLPVEVSCHALVRRGERSGAVLAFQDVSERRRDQERIRQLAYYDTLTELPNRRLLFDRLNQALAQARRHQWSLAVLFLDLDHFKEINDTLGHAVGDELLKVVAARLAATMRHGDTVSRQGGDEFVVLLAELTEPGDAALAAEKIIDTLSEPIPANRHTLRITTSIGIAIFPVGGSDDAHELMKKADIAMYAAKAAGRNRYCYFGAHLAPADFSPGSTL